MEIIAGKDGVAQYTMDVLYSSKRCYPRTVRSSCSTIRSRDGNAVSSTHGSVQTQDIFPSEDRYIATLSWWLRETLSREGRLIPSIAVFFTVVAAVLQFCRQQHL